jgi:hypothetical protein
MLAPAPADGRTVVPRALVLCSCICCTLVLASLGMFAFGQANGASQTQVASLGSPSASPTGTPGTEATLTPPAPTVTSTVRTTTAQPPGQPKRFIDGAAGVLTAPFRSLVHSNSDWARRIGYTLLALIVYGFGLGYVARWART